MEHRIRERASRGRVRVLGVPIDVLTAPELFESIARLVTDGQQHLVCYVNVECLNQALVDQRYRAILEEADLVYADGMGVVLASRLSEQSLPERITLGDVLPDLCRLAIDQRLRLFLLGGKPGVAKRSAEQLARRFPSLEIVGTDDGYFSDAQAPGIIDRINQAKPHLLLVGMGVPKQEKWLWRHRDALRVPVLWGVGALFEYYAGTTPRAPAWMRRMGLEWCFRLLVEPKRLWRRYLLGNAFFVLRTCALLLTDACLVALAWLGAYAARYGLNALFGFAINPVRPYVTSLPLIMSIWLVTCATFGLYRKLSVISPLTELAQVIRVTWVGLLATMAVAFLFKEFSFGRSVVLLFSVVMFVLLSLSRVLVRAVEQRLKQRKVGLRRTIIVGTGSLAKRLKEEIELWPIGYEVVGFVRDGHDTASGLSPAAILGSVKELASVIARYRVHDVFVASQHLELSQELNLLSSHERWPVNFHVVSEELEPVAQRIRLDRVMKLPLLNLPSLKFSGWYEWSKRGFDILASLLGLMVSLPLWGVIAVLIRLESRGYVLFAQERVGRNGQRFRMYKFRTMKVDTPVYAVAPNDTRDPRVTQLGRILRRWSLDELPQLLNILKGEMSVVGPRPEMPFLVNQYEPWQRRRLSVRPGLTCLWQVVGRKELPLHRNIEYDLYYVRHRGWLLDATILLRTIPAVLFRRGAF